MKHLVVVCGTGTEVGKTHISTRLLRRCAELGLMARGLKPVESGCGVERVGPDQMALSAASTSPSSSPPPFALPEALSPHLAARRAGTSLALEPILDWVDRESGDVDLLLVESAGGLLSPLSRGLSNLELLLALAPTAVVVSSRDRLGVLHEVASVARLLDRALPSLTERLVAILQPPVAPDGSTGSNARELVELGILHNVVEASRYGDDGADAVLRLCLGFVQPNPSLLSRG